MATAPSLSGQREKNAANWCLEKYFAKDVGYIKIEAIAHNSALWLHYLIQMRNLTLQSLSQFTLALTEPMPLWIKTMRKFQYLLAKSRFDRLFAKIKRRLSIPFRAPSLCDLSPPTKPAIPRARDVR